MSWQGRRVLVTGADGFIGSHLTETLARAGAEVRAFCLYTSSGSLGWLDAADPDLREALDVRRGDIRDARFVERCCEDVDVIFHLAALVAIPYSYAAPESFLDTNVRGTMNVLEAVRRGGCARLVHASTSEVYGSPDSLPILETHPLRGQSPYSASKIAADKMCEAYHCSFETPVVTLRPFNTYGPRQSSRAVIPTILSQLIAGRTKVELGSLAPRRDLTYVTDTVAGFMAAGIVPAIEGRTIQLGTGVTTSVEAVFRLACQVCGVEATTASVPERLRPVGSEVMVLQSDPSLARELMGWTAKVDLAEGLRMTAEWLRENQKRYDPHVYAT
jgi:NAD dependent epimerase/dehydratase